MKYFKGGGFGQFKQRRGEKVRKKNQWKGKKPMEAVTVVHGGERRWREGGLKGRHFWVVG